MIVPLIVCLAIFAPDDIDSVDLAGLLDFETDVASSTALSLRESPGIITVITREEILRAGARDLVDVLNLVPGVAFGLDVQGVMGIGFRGLWGHEGKVLLMIDGQQMNELLYGTLQFGNDIPVEHIERIEIIRGPGSVIYGGFAELAVINVVTRTVQTLKGAAVAGSYGRMRDTTGRWLGHAGVGERFGDIEMTAQASIGHAIRSDRIYVDSEGNHLDMQNASNLDPGFVDVGVSFHGLSVRFIYNDYRMTQQTEYGVNLDAPVHMNFTTARGEVRYDWEIATNLTLTSKVQYTWQKPWNVSDPNSADYYNKVATRLSPVLMLNYAPTDDLSLALGGQINFDRGATILSDPTSLADEGFNGVRVVSYTNYIAFAEALWRTKIVNVEGGARVEHHSEFGGSFVPRLALTHVFGDLHVKGLATRSFRAPTFENIAANPDISPERTNAFEVETGYRFNEHVFASVNVFDITIYHPIVYGYTGDLADTYINANKIGTRGVESVVRFVRKGSYATLGYSFYTTAGKPTDSTYQVPGQNNVSLGFPAHKLTLNTSIKIAGGFSLGGTAMAMSRRYAITGFDADGNPLQRSFHPVVYLTAVAYYENLLLDGLDLSLSLHNLGDATNPLIQPYAGGHPPIPLAGREVVARLAYAF